jgi:hypothetical protein
VKTEEKFRNKYKVNESVGGNIACAISELYAKQCRLQYGWENLDLKRWRQHLKIFLPSSILTKAYPTIEILSPIQSGWTISSRN